jgi:hypothetical protein
MISLCIQMLRHLTTAMKQTLGTDIGTRHAPADLARDIDVLMQSFHEHGVYMLNRGQKLDSDDLPVVDTVSNGLAALSEGGNHSPLAEYNSTFKRLQKCQRMTPVVDISEETSPDATAASSPSDPRAPESITPTPSEDSVEDEVDLSPNENLEVEDYSASSGSLDDEPTLSIDSFEDIKLEMDLVELEDKKEGEDVGEDEN